MDSPQRPVLSPPKILHPLSPERMNQQTVPASPSLPTDLLSLHHKNTKGVSEVQAKVAFLNSLSRGNSPLTHTQSAAANAALQRAILGREEAESALISLQEEYSEAQSRERRISERLESLLEELHAAKERQAHERSIFEKEIRKARKEAFRASSTLVKLQEELKQSKSETKALKDEVNTERESKDRAKQEAFERAYALAGLTEELEELKGQLRSLEAANRMSARGARAHQTRIANSGRISITEGDLAFLITPRRPKRAAVGSVKSPAFDTNAGDLVEATPPKRQRLSECTTAVETEEVTPDASLCNANNDEIEDLRDELEYERRRRAEAEEMIHFMNIECQFQRCSCRIAESQGRPYIYDAEYYEQVQKPHVETNAGIGQKDCPAHVEAQHEAVVCYPESSHTPSVEPPSHLSGHVDGTSDADSMAEPNMKPEPIEPPEKMRMPEEPLVTFSPETGTFKTFPSPLRSNIPPHKAVSPRIPEQPVFNPAGKSWRDPAPPSAYPPEDSSHSKLTSDSRTAHVAHADGAFDLPKVSRPPAEIRSSRPAERDPHVSQTTSKRVPLRSEIEHRTSDSSGILPDTPVSREYALAQIAARRDRARSKQRSVSANEASGRKIPLTGSGTITSGRAPRRMPNLRPEARSEKDLAERRDLSAPVRMYQ
ncbi:hypothetical protein PDE_00416 [Penicillium oxalicum 114-2]|uniref:DNA endonuclease activator Ctp1 C-terminal domain-containing protein n=1 Tax=Penicillium oxalicum (strain 114-2 / CGMCC 5302) TaxID=933388 RepID=S8AIC0_PENO1|nr:hypothetical protein PDE_00416 [Penicillium oxalicum 114-2]